MLKKILLSLLVATYVYAGTITIAVATNVTFPIKKLKEEFKLLYPKTKVEVVFGSSGKLTSQIIRGAPFSIFMSANMKYPNDLYTYGFATTKPLVYARGALVYLSLKERDFTTGMKLLNKKDISKIAVANPVTAPYGRAAFEAMKNAGILEDVMSKFIYSKSISGTVANTLNAADIGIVAKSALYSDSLKKYNKIEKNKNWKDVDDRLYTPIKQGIVVLKVGKNNDEVATFYDFILSEKAKKVFKDFGYIVPQASI